MRIGASKPEDAPGSKPWHPEDIKAAVRKRGLSLAALSRQHGFNEGAARIVLYKPWARWEQIISDFLGVPAKEIWPQRYLPNGQRRQGLSSRKG